MKLDFFFVPTTTFWLYFIFYIVWMIKHRDFHDLEESL